MIVGFVSLSLWGIMEHLLVVQVELCASGRGQACNSSRGVSMSGLTAFHVVMMPFCSQAAEVG